MLLLLRRSVLNVIFIWFCSYNDPCDCSLMRVTSVILERPTVGYVNESIAHVYNFTASRVSRSDHFHYLQAFVEIHIDIDCRVMLIDLNVEELLSNTYRPSFVQYRLNTCEFIRFGSFNTFYARNTSEPLKEIVLDKSKDKIIFPAGVYNFQNIIIHIESIPNNFPFQNGRVNIKFLYKKCVAGYGHVDLQLKMLPKRRAPNSKPPK